LKEEIVKSRSLIFCILSVCSLFVSVAAMAQAQGSSRFIPLQEQAQGQSLTGANLLNDSLFSNPASSAFIQVYSVDATFLGPRHFAGSVLDTRTSFVGGAIGYARQPTQFEDKLSHAAHGTLSARVLPWLGVGVGGHVLWSPDANGNPARHTDVDVGLLMNMEPVQVGLTTRNVMGGNDSLRDFRQTSLGARINYEQILFLSATVQSAPDSFRPEQYGFGAEYVSPYKFSLKGGYRIRPDENRSYWSAGASVISPKVSLHYAVLFPSDETESMQHMVGTTVLF
jgi:hypothetical protein